MHNYLEANDDVPWDDLQYNFGEIMYGGHITDFWDRRITNTYLKVEEPRARAATLTVAMLTLARLTMAMLTAWLCLPQVLLSPGLLDEKSGLQLAPGYPPCLEGDAATYAGYIEENLPAESPLLFGLHPNSQISLLQQQAATLFSSVLVLSGSGGGGGGSGKETRAADTLGDLKTRLPAQFKMIEIKTALKEAPTPYVVCALQELERANAVLTEMGRALTELELGLQGALNISDLMEALIANLTANEVPLTLTPTLTLTLTLIANLTASEVPRLWLWLEICMLLTTTLRQTTCYFTTCYLPLTARHSLLTRCRRCGSRSAARSAPQARTTASRSPPGSRTSCCALSSSRRGSTYRASSTCCRAQSGSRGCGTRWATSPPACR